MENLSRCNSVRFASVDGPDQYVLGMGSNRSAWQSEEQRDRKDRPPRRPSRDLGFLQPIAGNLFIDESDNVDCVQGQLSQKVRRSPIQQCHQRKSILKNSKYNSKSQTGVDPIKRESERSLPLSNEGKEFLDENDDDIHEQEVSHLAQKHRNSILNLPQLAISFERKSLEPSSSDSLPGLLVFNDSERSLLSRLSSSLEINPNIDD